MGTADYFFVLLREVLAREVRDDFARVALDGAAAARFVGFRVALPRVPLPLAAPPRVVSAALTLFAAAFPAALAALPAPRTAASPSLSILPAARLACPVACSAFLACRVAAAFFAEADRCAFV